MKKLFAILAAVFLLVLMACSGGSSGGNTSPPLSSAKAITAFSLNGVAGTINDTGKTIAVTMPSGTAVTNLVATFTTTGASVKVGSTLQITGTTVNDFTNPVKYTVTAADSSTQDYTVTITYIPFKMDGSTWKTAVDTDGNLFTILTKWGSSLLVKSNKNGATSWEVSTGCDISSNPAILGTEAFLQCLKGTAVSILRFSTATGEKTYEEQITTNGGLGTLTSDPSGTGLFVQYSDLNSGSDTMWGIWIDRDVNQLSGFARGLDGLVATGTTNVFLPKFTGGFDIVVDKYSKDLSTETNAINLISVGEPSGIALSSDGKKLLVTTGGDFMSRPQGAPPTLMSLFVLDIATSGITQLQLSQFYGNGPADIVYNPKDGLLYGIVQAATGYAVVTINPTTGVTANLVTGIQGNNSINRPYLTVDLTNKRLYVSNSTTDPTRIWVYDLSGNPLF